MISVTAGDTTVEATEGHPFWVPEVAEQDERPEVAGLAKVGKDGRSTGRWLRASQLRVGDRVLLRSGRTAPISAVSAKAGRCLVYNFEVAGLHSYAVGANGLLVHNQGNCDLPRLTKGMRAKQRVIAKGRKIREVDGLVEQYGGRASDWKKYKSWDSNGQEWHWYERPGSGPVKMKPK
ncbi:MAG: polymorphic toxin-type HINT domain-containing protein [Phycisphaerae bacterium]